MSEILVIDGDGAARALIEQTLVQQGFTVTAVGDGSAALRLMETKAFALVVVEIGLPGPLDGIATVRQAKARQPGLKCLFTSGFAAAQLWSSIGFEDYIAKPFRRRELLGCVFELLERDAAVGEVVAEDLEYRADNSGNSWFDRAQLGSEAVARHPRTN